MGKISVIVIDQPDKDASAVSFRPTAISLFAGAGGCSLGFGQAGYDIRFATYIDADAVESYRRNFPGTPCEAADIRQLTAEAVLQRLGLNPGELGHRVGSPAQPRMLGLARAHAAAPAVAPV